MWTSFDKRYPYSGGTSTTSGLRCKKCIERYHKSFCGELKMAASVVFRSFGACAFLFVSGCVVGSLILFSAVSIYDRALSLGFVLMCDAKCHAFTVSRSFAVVITCPFAIAVCNPIYQTLHANICSKRYADCRCYL